MENLKKTSVQLLENLEKTWKAESSKTKKSDGKMYGANICKTLHTWFPNQLLNTKQTKSYSLGMFWYI